MQYACQRTAANGARVSKLVLEANTFNEERILDMLSRLVKEGGRLSISTENHELNASFNRVDTGKQDQSGE